MPTSLGEGATVLGASLLVALLGLALVAIAATVRNPVIRGRSGGRTRPGGGLRAVLAVTTLVLPLMALAAAVPQASATPSQRDTGSPRDAGAPRSAAPAEHTATVRYGPLDLPPYTGDMGGDPAHAGHQGTMATYVNPTYQLPCQNCYITGLQPDLVYADGSEANYQTGAMLHHMVMFDRLHTDVTCGPRGVGALTGRRVFASGNERTGAHLPPGYGYHLGGTPLSAMTELMNMSPKPQQVYLTMRVSWVDAADATATHLKDVIPVWLDVDNCGDSQYSIPAGPSHRIWTWHSTVSGDIVTVGGHVHDHGKSITLSNATRHQTICVSRAGYGMGGTEGMGGMEGMGHMDDMGHVESMSTCVGDPVATVHRGDALQLDSFYDSPVPDDTVMGIMIAYLHVN